MRGFMLHGIAVHSPVPLSAGPVPRGWRGPTWRITVRESSELSAVGDVLVATDDPLTGRHYVLTASPSDWTITFPGVASMRLERHTNSLDVVRSPAASDDLLSLLLSGPGITGLALAQGEVLIHASAVTWTGSTTPVVAFVGPSGSGKSSVARLLAGGQRLLFSDDALRVEPTLDGVVAYRGTVESRLRAMVSLPEDQSTSVRESPDGRRVVNDRRMAPASGRLALVVRPRLVQTSGELAVRRLHGVEAAMTLAASWPVDGIRDADLKRRQLEAAAKVAGTVAIISVEIPWVAAPGPDQVAELGGLLEAELRAETPC